MPDRRPDPLKGALAGLVAGLAASWAMNLFQRGWTQLAGDEGGGAPATEKAVDRVARAATGASVPDDAKPAAGQAVHYGFGALLGLAYGVIAEYWPRATAGGGAAFGLSSAMLFDEAAVPVAGLGDAPWDSPASTHAYTLASHLVFGGAAEGARRLVRAAV